MNRTRLSLKILTLGFCLALVASAGRSQEVPAESKTVEIVAADGIIVYVDTYVGDPSAPTILLFHQAGSNARAEYAGLIPRLMDEGFNVLAPDQRRGGDRLGGENRTVAGLGEAEYSYCDADTRPTSRPRVSTAPPCSTRIEPVGLRTPGKWFASFCVASSD